MDPLLAIQGASVVALLIAVPLAPGFGQWVDPFPLGRAEAALVTLAGLGAVFYAGFIWLALAAGPVFAAQESYIVRVRGWSGRWSCWTSGSRRWLGPRWR